MVRKLRVTGEFLRVDERLGRLPGVFARFDGLVAAFLHGSYGTPHQTPLSDVDLAVVYRPERLPDLRELANLQGDVEDALGLEDVSVTVLNRTPLPFQLRVLTDGRVLYVADPVALADFRERVCKLYGDFEPDYRRLALDYDRALKEAYAPLKEACTLLKEACAPMDEVPPSHSSGESQDSARARIRGRAKGEDPDPGGPTTPDEPGRPAADPPRNGAEGVPETRPAMNGEPPTTTLGVIDREKVRDKIDFIRRNLVQLEALARRGPAALRDDKIAEAAAVHMLQTSIEAMIDVANHIVARLGLGVPKSYREAIDLLVEAGILPAEHRATFHRMVRFRNRAVHLYDTISPEEVHGILAHRLGDFDLFIGAVVRRLF
ncbi:type VII toxin-antitoxin system HepT family RNase toxin [Thermaerobacter litoralis]